MTMKHSRNFISFILAIAMIFSGMCFDSKEADSLLACINQKGVTSTLSPSDNLSDYPEFRTEDFTSARILANNIKSESRSEEKNNSRTDLHLSFADILQKNFATFFVTVSCELFEDIRSNSVIITYIHQMDGKK